MEYRFTQDYESNSWEFFFQNETPEGYVSTENITNAMNYLKSENNFRLFSEGLTKLMEKCGYRGSLSDPEEKAIYLYNKLCTIGTPPSKFDNIKKWFTGPQRPALDSKGRIEMFQVCFALSANINDTVWFFHHVYFDRSFNCRTIEEAVFYYCLKNKKSYEYSLQLINEIEKFPETHSNAPIYTSDIQNALNDFESVEDLFAFFKKNKNIFHDWNQRAFQQIKSNLEVIRGNEYDKIFMHTHKLSSNTIVDKKCSLIIQEIYSHYVDNDYYSEADPSFRQQITSIDFMLKCILEWKSGLRKNTDVPKIVRENFPSKTTFSKILNAIENKSSVSPTYDSVRKCLVLLEFYKFWCNASLHPNKFDNDNAFDIFIDQINSILKTCGYSDLFEGNPYDWLFLWAAKTDSPLTTLRDAVSDLTS